MKMCFEMKDLHLLCIEIKIDTFHLFENVFHFIGSFLKGSFILNYHKYLN